jgi:hypothetical protein
MTPEMRGNTWQRLQGRTGLRMTCGKAPGEGPETGIIPGSRQALRARPTVAQPNGFCMEIHGTPAKWVSSVMIVRIVCSSMVAARRASQK